VFVGRETYGKFLPLGTGFFVGVRHKGYDFHFLVTADHVLDLIEGPSLWLRTNTQAGTIGPSIKIEKAKKILVPRELDLAILPIPSPPSPCTSAVILIDRDHYNDLLRDIWKPELGVEVSTVGLYTSHYGQAKNIPVVRIGHIALLPDEPVLTNRGFIQAYLVETRSIMGLPVFLNIPDLRAANRQVEIREGIGAIFIGVMLGYHLVASAEDQIVVPAMQGDVGGSDEPSLDERNTGFAVVLPIERIFETMESDTLRKSMDDAIERLSKSAPDSEAGQPTANDE